MASAPALISGSHHTKSYLSAAGRLPLNISSLPTHLPSSPLPFPPLPPPNPPPHPIPSSTTASPPPPLRPSSLHGQSNSARVARRRSRRSGLAWGGLHRVRPSGSTWGCRPSPAATPPPVAPPSRSSSGNAGFP
ncbi:hypothetical protein PVAP13_2NG308603 [Panicum virgatum]|uniref:Uncharacterized protein n=1 Tax=Panicum virgatum TaxID=38727 RepID=A0A8T0VIW4_PANVG|nr:hypothetical protein PVAP13_2NG308603 [Panicum virgatum]